MVGYDYEELLRRLKEVGCTTDRLGYTKQVHRDREVWIIKSKGRDFRLDIRDGEVPFDVVDSLVNRLGLPRGPFDI